MQQYESNKKNEKDLPFQRKEAGSSAGNLGTTLKDNRPQTVLQKKLANDLTNKTVQKKNNTGLPDNLKNGIESLSGISVNDVKVHYNSSKPAQLNAHAYAHGNDIHLASGQEKHLPHEAWHVVQQKQGRVNPTTQLKGKINVNDDAGLEQEADVMGQKAVQMKTWSVGTSRGQQHNGVLQMKKTVMTWSPQIYKWNGNSTVVGKEMEAYIDPDDIQQGQSANMNSSQDKMMKAIKTKYKLQGYQLVKGHLLNDNLGGPASDKNLYPITKGANGDHLHYVENKVKTILQSDEGVYYKVEVKGTPDINTKKSQFKTTVGDWDKSTASPSKVTNKEIRIVNSDIGSADATGEVTDGAGKTKGVDRYKDEDGTVELPEPAKSKKVLTGTKYELVLFTSKTGGSPNRVEWDPAKKEQSGLDMKFGKNFTITKVKFDVATGTGTATGVVFKTPKALNKKTLSFDIKKRAGIEYGGYIDKAVADGKIKLQLKGMSPVEFDELDIRDDGIYGEGDVLTDIPLIRGAGIKIKLEGNDISLIKKFTMQEFHLPPPFNVTRADVTVVVNINGLKANGALDFEIANVGTGSLTAIASTDELAFYGEFKFDSKFFNPAEMSMSYIDGKLEGSGILKINSGKVPGLNDATINAKYDSDGLVINGNAEPNIPGINSSLSITYDKGAFTFAGWGAYKNGMLDGSMTIGFTNRNVDENGNPLNSLNDHFTPYGKGLLKIKLANNLEAEAGAKLLRNGEIEMNGKIGIAEPVNLFNRKSLEQQLFNRKIDIPILGVDLGIAGIGIFGSIGAKADFFAGIGPGILKNLSASVVYNPSHEDKTKIEGNVEFNVPGNAGIKLTVPMAIVAKAEAIGIELARGEGRLDFGGQLSANASVSDKVKLKWTPVGGLEFSARPKANANVQLTLDAKAALFIRIIGGIEKEWKYDLFESKFGPLISFNAEFPIEYKEHEPFNLNTNDIKYKKKPEVPVQKIAEEYSENAFMPQNVKEAGASDKVNYLTIFINRLGYGPREAGWEEGTKEKSVSNVKPPLSKLYDVTQIVFEKGVGGKVIGVAFKDVKDISTVQGLSIAISKITKYALEGIIEPDSVKNALQEKIVFEDINKAICFGYADLASAQFTENGLNAEGKLISQIELLKDADIDFVIKDDQPSFRKVFEAGEFHVPPPFKVTKSTLTITADGNGIKVTGDIDFNGGKLGKGKMKGSFGSGEGFKLSGEFDLDESLFNEGKIKMTYQNGAFNADGSAKLSVPGLKAGNVTIHLSKESFKAGGGFELDSNIPGISEGKVNAELIWKGGRNFELVATGSANSSIPGLKIELNVQRVNGAWLISGEGTYKNDLLEGKVKVGATNQGVDKDGKLTGSPGNKFSYFGGGDLKMQLAPWLIVEGGAHFLPNGEPELRGAIKMAEALTFFNERVFKPEPYKTPALAIPLFAISLFGYNIGLEAKVEGGTEASAKIGPGQVEELSASILYNPYEKGKNKLKGKARVAIPNNVELRVFGSGSIGANMLVGSIHGGIELGGAMAINTPISAEAIVSWWGDKGFAMEANAEAISQAKLKLDVKAILDIYIALYKSKKWDKKLKEKDFGSGLKLGIKIPIKYEAGKGFTLNLNNVEFVKPDIHFGNIVKEAAKESFSKEEE